MKCVFRRPFIVAAVFFAFLLFSAAVHAEPLKFSSSTQFLWGDDLLGDSQAIVAQYLRLNYLPDNKKFSVAGYGRLSKDFGSSSIRENDLTGRLYYLYLDYALSDTVSLRLGRQFTNFTGGTAIIDGATVNINKVGPVGITVSGGRDVRLGLDSELTRNGNYFAGVGVYLREIPNLQLGVSYVLKYDESDLARQALGMNFRYFYKGIVSPYAEVRYDWLSKAFDEASLGVDFFPARNLMVKAEFYHSYPTFDATSIYSVFAVDKYREYLIKAEYSLDAPVSLFAAYARQTYQDSLNADKYMIGARVYPNDKLTVTASFDYRIGYSEYNGLSGQTKGKLYGFEVTGDYRFRKDLAVSAGVQYDTYNRPDIIGTNNYARRYWLGGRWNATKSVAVSARVEDDDNPNFSHRVLGRFALEWNL